jgi:hypothetical protein
MGNEFWGLKETSNFKDVTKLLRLIERYAPEASSWDVESKGDPVTDNPREKLKSEVQ